MYDYPCPECTKTTRDYYCQGCYSLHWQENFQNWTSGDSNLDILIQKSQTQAVEDYQLIEWIEYLNFHDIKFIANGGFGSVYSATWADGPISRGEFSGYDFFWDVKKSQWRRNPNFKVALKKIPDPDAQRLVEILKEVIMNV